MRTFDGWLDPVFGGSMMNVAADGFGAGETINLSYGPCGHGFGFISSEVFVCPKTGTTDTISTATPVTENMRILIIHTAQKKTPWWRPFPLALGVCIC